MINHKKIALAPALGAPLLPDVGTVGNAFGELGLIRSSGTYCAIKTALTVIPYARTLTPVGMVQLFLGEITPYLLIACVPCESSGSDLKSALKSLTLFLIDLYKNPSATLLGASAGITALQTVDRLFKGAFSEYTLYQVKAATLAVTDYCAQNIHPAASTTNSPFTAVGSAAESSLLYMTSALLYVRDRFSRGLASIVLGPLAYATAATAAEVEIVPAIDLRGEFHKITPYLELPLGRPTTPYGHDSITLHLYQRIDSLIQSSAEADASFIAELRNALITLFQRDIKIMLEVLSDRNLRQKYSLNFFQIRLALILGPVPHCDLDMAEKLKNFLEELPDTLFSKKDRLSGYNSIEADKWKFYQKTVNIILRAIQTLTLGTEPNWTETIPWLSLSQGDEQDKVMREFGSKLWKNFQDPLFPTVNRLDGQFHQASAFSTALVWPSISEPGYEIAARKTTGSQSGYIIKDGTGKKWLAKPDLRKENELSHRLLSHLGVPVPPMRYLSLGPNKYVCSQFIEGAKSLEKTVPGTDWDPGQMLLLIVRVHFANINDMHDNNILFTAGMLWVVDSDRHSTHAGCRPYAHLRPFVTVKDELAIPFIEKDGQRTPHNVFPKDHFDLSRSHALTTMKTARTLDMLRAIQGTLAAYENLPASEKAALQENHQVWTSLYGPHIDAMMRGEISETELFSNSAALREAVAKFNERYPKVEATLV